MSKFEVGDFVKYDGHHHEHFIGKVIAINLRNNTVHVRRNFDNDKSKSNYAISYYNRYLNKIL